MHLSQLAKDMLAVTAMLYLYCVLHFAVGRVWMHVVERRVSVGQAADMGLSASASLLRDSTTCKSGLLFGMSASLTQQVGNSDGWELPTNLKTQMC